MTQYWLGGISGLVVALGLLSLPFAADQAVFTHGVMSGEVTATSANVWVRADQAATVSIEYAETSEWRQSKAGGEIQVVAENDFTGVILLNGLQPATRYYYRVAPRLPASSASLGGSFVTAPAADAFHDVTFLWGGDVGGQGFCRNPDYAIFDALTAQAADFFLYGGDTIYADSPCPSPPNAPGSDFKAETQEQFRAKYKYQLEDLKLQKLLKDTSVYAIWDDHEVKNDFAGPTSPLTPLGLKAFSEYFPFPRFRNEHRLYRSFRWGKHLELFILDTRQYRSPNARSDGPEKTMLGAEQLRWLLEGLTSSTATWQIIMTSVPLSAQTGGPITGNDSWAKGNFSDGFHHELRKIVATLQKQQKRNVMWLSTDIHVARMLSYDPDQDGVVNFYESISGPLSAITGDLDPLDAEFHPSLIYEENKFFNFGIVRVDGKSGTLTIEIRDQEGKIHYTSTFPVRPPLSS